MLGDQEVCYGPTILDSRIGWDRRAHQLRLQHLGLRDPGSMAKRQSGGGRFLVRGCYTTAALAVNFVVCRFAVAVPFNWGRASSLFGMVEGVVCERRGLGGQDLERPLKVYRLGSAPTPSS